MIFPWFSYDFPIFPWFSHDFLIHLTSGTQPVLPRPVQPALPAGSAHRVVAHQRQRRGLGLGQEPADDAWRDGINVYIYIDMIYIYILYIYKCVYIYMFFSLPFPEAINAATELSEFNRHVVLSRHGRSTRQRIHRAWLRICEWNPLVDLLVNQNHCNPC